MKPREMEDEILTALETRENLYFEGKPGIGKTEIPQGIARRLGIGFKRIVVPQYEEVDLRGIPEVNERKRTVFYPTEELPYAERDGERGILLWDEHKSGKPSVQIIAHQILDSRKLGQLYELPPGWINILTGNRAEDYAFVYELPETVRTRCAMYTVEEDFNDWKKWALDSGSIVPEIMAFLNANPQDFVHFEPSKPATNRALPRTWHALSKYIVGRRNRGRSLEYVDLKEGQKTPFLEAVIARVGEAAGHKFYGWFKVWKEVPDIDGILQGNVHTVPKKVDIQWCVVSSLTAKMMLLDPKDKTFMPYCKNALKYIGGLTSDIVMGFLADCTETAWWAKVKTKLIATEEWATLSEKHARTIVGEAS